MCERLEDMLRQLHVPDALAYQWHATGHVSMCVTHILLHSTIVLYSSIALSSALAVLESQVGDAFCSARQWHRLCLLHIWHSQVIPNLTPTSWFGGLPSYPSWLLPSSPLVRSYDWSQHDVLHQTLCTSGLTGHQGWMYNAADGPSYWNTLSVAKPLTNCR